MSARVDLKRKTTYMTVTGEEHAANRVPTLRRPNTRARLQIPNLQRAYAHVSLEPQNHSWNSPFAALANT